jgi:glycine dehydrogenase subunit 1
LAFSIHMSLLGETGLRKLALLNHEKALATRDALAAIPGVEILTPRFFNEFAVRLPKPAAEVVEALGNQRILAGVPYSRLAPGVGMDDVLLVAATETTLDADIQILAKSLTKVLGA